MTSSFDRESRPADAGPAQPPVRNARTGFPNPASVALLVAFALVTAFYAWTTRSNHLSWHFGREQKDYYNLLVHGFLDGQLGLKAEVPRELLQCPDPYDPARRPEGIALHDASLYRGKYYIYYGVVPAVVALLPFRLITGIDLPLPAAVLGFAVGAYAIALLIVAGLRRRFLPRCGPVMTGLLGVTFGFASCAPILLRRSSMYELPIVSGGFFALAALGCLIRALERPGGVRWIALASLAWGLAIGSRPTYLLAPLTLVLVLISWRRHPAGPAGTGARQVARWSAAFGPIAAVGLCLAAYNYARFGSPTEFGVSYILSGVYESRIEHFRLRYVPWNGFAYLFSPGEWGRYFPFFHGVPIAWPRPRQHYGMDIAFGLLTNVPFYWLALFTLGPLVGRSGRGRAGFRTVVAMIAAIGGGVLAIVVLFYAAMVRYLGDFAPALALLALLGGMAVMDRANRCGARWRRVAARVLIGALAILSGFSISAFSVQVYGRLETFNPRGFAALARIADAPNYWFMRRPDGAAILRVVFPRAPRAGEREELLRTGWGEEKDRVFVVYPDAGHVQFEFEHHGAPPVRSAPVAVDRTAAHELRVAMAPLFPPPSWPGYRGREGGETARLLRQVRIVLDGTAVLDRHQSLYDAAPDTLVIGGGGGSAPFSGRIITVDREPLDVTLKSLSASLAALPEPWRLPGDGTWRLKLQFPRAQAGIREPLVVSGVTGRGDFLAVEYLGGDRLRLLLDHWGSQVRFSDSLEYEPGRAYQLEISHPAYTGRLPAGPGTPADLGVRLDGRVVWSVGVILYPAEQGDVFLGRNPIGGSSCGEKFTGTIQPAPTAASPPWHNLSRPP